MTMKQYRITEEMCEVEVKLLNAKIDHLQAKRALWFIYDSFLNQGKEVYVKGNNNKYAVLEKDESIPRSFFENEQFISRESLVELRDKEEIRACFYDELIRCYDEGDAVLHDATTDEFRVISKDGSFFSR